MTVCLLCGREWSGKEDDVLCAIPNNMLGSSPALMATNAGVRHRSPEDIASCLSLTGGTIDKTAAMNIPGLAELVFTKAWSAAMR